MVTLFAHTHYITHALDSFFKRLLKLCNDGLSHFLKENLKSKSEIMTPAPSSSNTSGAGSGTRAGLFRTPISGGVQSATSVHDLPRPALAVRNLMEQVYN